MHPKQRPAHCTCWGRNPPPLAPAGSWTHPRARKQWTTCGPARQATPAWAALAQDCALHATSLGYAALTLSSGVAGTHDCSCYKGRFLHILAKCEPATRFLACRACFWRGGRTLSSPPSSSASPSGRSCPWVSGYYLLCSVVPLLPSAPVSAACPMCLPACPAPTTGNGEGLQVLRYEKGQEYEGHYVSFSSGVEVFCKHVFGVLISS